MTTITVSRDAKPISSDLFGIFFEDLNFAADGGLYAELIQNRSFEYQPTERWEWNALSFWALVKRGGGEGAWLVGDAAPIHPNNPRFLVLEVRAPGDGVGIANEGFGGIAVTAGETYDAAFFARQLFMNEKWGSDSGIDDRPMPVKLRLESADGEALCETAVEVRGREWHKIAATLVPTASDDSARFVLLAEARGGIALDEFSLMPRKTFRDRPNGLRSDLAQAIADLEPKFVRFPGGCLVHGDGLGNAYKWKDSIGPVEQRKGQRNLWSYHQSLGLGYFEYFQFCEDIGAKPLPVLPAAVSCQNSDHTPGVGQQCVPLSEMDAYVQDIFDLIEWANGPATSPWGAKRAEAGHPAPFGLEYLGIGNEDAISEGFKERFRILYAALKERHPEITVVGTVGPFPEGEDFDEGWSLASELAVPVVDEHYYMKPEWFWDNLERYDSYDRSASQVYLGEYAAHEPDRKSTLRAALAEAACLTQLERNGDIVKFSSYAPLLAKRGYTQWSPDLIYFDNRSVNVTPSYFVQQLFSRNAGDEYLATAVASDAPKQVVTSCVRESATGDVIVKIVSRSDEPVAVQCDLSALGPVSATAERSVLSGDPDADNVFGQPPTVAVVTTTIPVAPQFAVEVPAHSLTVLRVKPQNR
jgi:alpha-L-arabinofuranosidase